MNDQSPLPADAALDALDALYDLCRGRGTTSECINAKIDTKKAILAIAALAPSPSGTAAQAVEADHFADASKMIPAAPAVGAPAPVMWQYRHFDTTNGVNSWGPWYEVEPRNAYVNTVEDSLREFRSYIAAGNKYELRALYAAPPHVTEAQPAVEGLTDLERKELAALREFAAGGCTIQKVIAELGPISLWSKAGLDEHIAKRISEALAASPVPMASSAQRERVIELAWQVYRNELHPIAMADQVAFTLAHGDPPAASLREQEDAADIVAWLLTQLSGGYSLQQRLYNDAPNAADSVAAGAWIQTVTQHLQRLAKDAKPNQLLLEHSGCGNNTQVDQLTVRLNPGDKVVLFKGPITAAIDAQRLGRGKEKTRIASTLNEGGIRHG
jgi:hypothetical protein